MSHNEELTFYSSLKSSITFFYLLMSENTLYICISRVYESSRIVFEFFVSNKIVSDSKETATKLLYWFIGFYFEAGFSCLTMFIKIVLLS